MHSILRISKQQGSTVRHREPLARCDWATEGGMAIDVNYTQYLVITYTGIKNLIKNMCMCVHVQLNYFALYLKLTQHCKSTIVQ